MVSKGPLVLNQEKSQPELWTNAESTRGFASQWLHSRSIDLPLQPRSRRWVFFLVVSLVAVLLGWAVLHLAIVSVLGGSVEPGKLQRAVAMDPSNPELHHRLGMVLSSSLEEADRAEGVKHIRLATELNPYAAQYWSDLAWVCELAGDIPCATHGVEQAVKINPMTPQLHWVAANTLLRIGQTDAAMAEFRRLLELDPMYGPATFHVCMGALGDPQLIEQKVLPPGKDPRVLLSYVNFLTSSGLADLARPVWVQTVERGTPFPLGLARPYIDHLFQFGRVEDAQSAWQDLEKLGVIPKAAADEEGNLIYNGGFEQVPLNTGFDWRTGASRYLALDFADSAPYAGKSCLRIDFTVSRNEAYLPLFQLVPVTPNQAYLLTAYVRSQEITSDSGPRLQVFDPQSPDNLIGVSETTVGTTPWHQVSFKFCTKPTTKLVQLSVARILSRAFPTEITGSFWLDAVVMKSLGPASESACGAPAH